MANLDGLKKYAMPTVRISLSLVFLWFGINQLIDPLMWIDYLPSFLSNTSNPAIFIYMNGILEVILGLLMILGFFVRFSALALGLHLLGIAATLGFNAIGVRDFGLSLATLGIFLNGEDDLCLQRKFQKTKLRRFFSYLGKRWWLTLGLGFYSVIFLYALASIDFLDSTFMLQAIDWIAASVPYFFIGALIGSLIDLAVASKRKKNIQFPLHAWLMAGFWLISIIIAYSVAKESSPVIILLFPLIYGVFFTSFAFATFIPTSFQYWQVAMSFSLAYSAIFFSWLILEVKRKNFTLRKILLIILFLIMIIGMYGCARELA